MIQLFQLRGKSTLFLAIVALGVAGSARAQVNVLTSNYDNERTNANLQEVALNPKTVTSKTFGKVGTFAVDGQVYAQPLFVSGLQISGKGKRNVLYVATMHNSVYAFDTDALPSDTPLWQVNLGASITAAMLNFTDILPETGILSTPVIDLSRQVLYVVSDSLENGGPVFRLHALSLQDGRELLNGPVKIEVSIPGFGVGSTEDGNLKFDAYIQLQRPGLALVNGTVYLAFGSHADFGNFHGWLMGYDASDLQRKPAVFNTSPNHWGGSIWQSGRAPAIDDQGNIYVTTGNGEFDGDESFSESILRFSSTLTPANAGDLTIADWFTPHDWDNLNNTDWDFGSTGAILVPKTKFLLSGSKAGVLYMMSRDHLGHIDDGESQAIQRAQVNQWGLFEMALWNHDSGPIVYAHEPWGSVKAFKIVKNQINETMLSATEPIRSMYTGIAVSAKGGAEGTGILWQTTGNYDIKGVPGTLHAFDGSDLTKELWNSQMVPDRDTLGRFAKFVAPTVANGRVYVPTFSNTVSVYGLLSGTLPGNNPPQVTAVVNAGSFLGDAVAPGEVVAIFGLGLGPAELTDMDATSSGSVPTSLAKTRVFFDGVPVPVIYTSSSQVSAVVPFNTLGPTTNVQVEFDGQMSASLVVPVAAAAPGFFSFDGNGGGFGAVNEDGTANGWDTPAAPGSVVTLYITGAGITDPASVDGLLTPTNGPFPSPILPVAISMDGHPAEVLYAGAAPGMLAGIVQVNVRIPDTAAVGVVISVTLSVGDYSSPNYISLNVQ